MNGITREVVTGLENNAKNGEMLASVLGQLSDGMWENSPRMTGYWVFAECNSSISNIRVSEDYSDSWYDYVRNPYRQMTDEEIKKFFVEKIKQIVREELKNNYKDKIQEEIYRKYGLDSHVWMIPADRIEDSSKAHKEYKEYMRENPFSFRGKFNKDNNTKLVYLSYDEEITVADAYNAYKTLCA